jgi:hypothetical protein
LERDAVDRRGPKRRKHISAPETDSNPDPNARARRPATRNAGPRLPAGRRSGDRGSTLKEGAEATVAEPKKVQPQCASALGPGRLGPVTTVRAGGEREAPARRRLLAIARREPSERNDRRARPSCARI